MDRPRGVGWRLRERHGEAAANRIEQLLREPEVTVWVFRVGDITTAVVGKEREALGHRLRAQSRGDAPAWTQLEVAEFEDDHGRRILIVEDAPDDLETARAAWLASPDGITGTKYALALEEAGQPDAALEVCAALWSDDYIAGPSTAGIIEWGRGNIEEAIRHLTTAADAESDPDYRPDIVGRLGHLRWDHFNDLAAEPLLREGMSAYTDARVDLARLLRVTDRYAEGRQLLVEGVEQGLLSCMLPLANLLDEEGDTEQAEQLYRDAFARGDAHSAWNLAVMLWDLDRDEEADEWAMKAARAGDRGAIQHLANETESPTE